MSLDQDGSVSRNGSVWAVLLACEGMAGYCDSRLLAEASMHSRIQVSRIDEGSPQTNCLSSAPPPQDTARLCFALVCSHFSIAPFD